jgi:pyochelin synthetase
MNAPALLDKLRSRGVEVFTDGHRVGVRPAGALTDDEREALRRHKADVLALLTAPPPAPPPAGDDDAFPRLFPDLDWANAMTLCLTCGWWGHRPDYPAHKAAEHPDGPGKTIAL